MYRILSIIITSLVVFLAPLFSLDYISDKLDSHLKAFYFLVALICPPIATNTSLFFSNFYQHKNK
ncbi:hypothetical protein [Helicobacter apodemus]|uniref:hypothetical protein n=1 Tax=Helicobacter apodemus TaxID=135569 RepID=UPI0013A57D9D|nr:hypothetical protein [Helicobacter apodemus]